MQMEGKKRQLRYDYLDHCELVTPARREPVVVRLLALTNCKQRNAEELTSVRPLRDVVGPAVDAPSCVKLREAK